MPSNRMKTHFCEVVQGCLHSRLLDSQDKLRDIYVECSLLFCSRGHGSKIEVGQTHGFLTRQTDEYEKHCIRQVKNDFAPMCCVINPGGADPATSTVSAVLYHLSVWPRSISRAAARPNVPRRTQLSSATRHRSSVVARKRPLWL